MNQFLTTSFCLLALLFASCEWSEKEKFNYACDGGVCIEVLKDSNDVIISYSDDNVIYKNGTEHLFKYYYKDSLGGKYLIGVEGAGLDTLGYVNSQTITKVGYKISNIVEERMTFPGEERYTQSGLGYKYLNRAEESLYPIESSGLVENERNIWVHPFRRYKYFAMLNINAYPFVKFPIKIGNEWEWELAVGGHRYTNPIWAVWEGATLRKHHYEVTGKTDYSIPGIGVRKVWEITATTTGDIGSTSAKFYYDDDYGFVMMEWHNLNKSIFRFDIEKITLPEANNM